MLGLIPIATPVELRQARHALTGRRVLVLSDGESLAAETLDRLAAAGAEAEAVTVRETVRADASGYCGRLLGAEELAGRLASGPLPDWVFFLPGYTARARPEQRFRPEEGLYTHGVTRTLFHTLSQVGRRWLERGSGGFAVVTRADGRFGLSGARSGDALAGLLYGAVRALHVEIPVIRTVVLDIGASVSAGTAADRLLDLASDGSHGHIELGLAGSRSYTTTLVTAYEQPSDVPGADGRLPLERGDTVLATGGGRGVTARVVRMMAEEVPCRYVLLGTTDLVDVKAALGVGDRDQLLHMSPEELAGHKQRQFAAMRRDDPALLPPAFERHWARIANSLEILQTVTHLRDLGARAEYRCLDVTDGRVTRRFAEEVVRAGGPVQALLHGAGVETSKPLCGKTRESWERTIAVKTGGLYNLSPVLGDATRLIMLFGSAAGTYGNPGQIDYAGASEFLSTAAHRLAADFPLARVRSVAWPAWAEVGMAMRPSSRAALERRDIPFMKVSEGLAWAGALLRSPSRIPTCLTLGYRDMPEETMATRATAPWNSARATRGRLVDLCYETGPDRWETRWTYQPELDGALGDHRVDGNIRVPIAFFAELVCQAAAACLDEPGGFTLRDLRVHQPLTLAPDRPRELRATLVRRQDGSLRVSVESSPVRPDHGWIPVTLQHASAEVRPLSGQQTVPRIETVFPHSESVPVAGVAEQFAAQGIEYGPAFREITSCRRERDSALHLVHLRAGAGWPADLRGPSFFDVGLLDLALQTLVFHPGSRAGGLPTAVDELIVHTALGDCCSEGWAVVDAGDEQLNVTLADPAGHVMAEIRNLELTGRES
ncbi:SDR family NAD(P)-dependent oxidoreductase [Streptomyces microflavus]|uniref:SDR family NAD(P)-dependent oxidoreductase n=1 Tax=Streptomyces microflavus TaxID=1919 RepID=UPI002E36A0E2|nr:SDR family NAD(P)-dependent oxidoreductase [Streptomyces microflavus]WSS38160.1 SDR family NAD(P)-dependent oxidoreductase [Streptomyces microflavus]WST13122.1 SDR family NAD(P)-dependent oxidoreductase [Streptomyces microflavus]